MGVGIGRRTFILTTTYGIIDRIKKVMALDDDKKIGLGKFTLKFDLGRESLLLADMREIQSYLNQETRSIDNVYTAQIWGGAQEHTCSPYMTREGYYIEVEVTTMRGRNI